MKLGSYERIMKVFHVLMKYHGYCNISIYVKNYYTQTAKAGEQIFIKANFTLNKCLILIS